MLDPTATLLSASGVPEAQLEEAVPEQEDPNSSIGLPCCA
jgi:hypothetical protein